MERSDATPSWKTARSALELLHPDGAVDETLVLGTACPAVFAQPASSATGPRRLVVLAPGVRECRRRGWLEEAIAALATRVDEQAIAYVIVPVGWRRRTVALLRSRGLAPGAVFLHLPDRSNPRHVVPAQIGPIRYAITNLMAPRRWKRRLVERALKPLTPHLMRFMPAAGFVATRPQSSEPLAWLTRYPQLAHAVPTAILSIGRGGASGVLHTFVESSAEPTLAVKIGLTDPMRRARDREAMMLQRLAAGVSAAGADVPSLVGAANEANGTVAETALSGRPLASLLADEPGILPDVLVTLAGWLERWHLVTRTLVPLDDKTVDTVLEQARRLAPELPTGDAYVRRLARLCESRVGSRIPLVGTHNDLTMVNILLARNGRLGVVDWEAAAEHALPLTDFFYAAADASAAITRYADRAAAFEATFLEGGELSSAVRALRARLCDRAEIDPELSELCFHACWLMHAANEYDRPNRLRKRPFLAIVQLLAAKPDEHYPLR